MSLCGRPASRLTPFSGCTMPRKPLHGLAEALEEGCIRGFFLDFLVRVQRWFLALVARCLLKKLRRPPCPPQASKTLPSHPVEAWLALAYPPSSHPYFQENTNERVYCAHGTAAPPTSPHVVGGRPNVNPGFDECNLGTGEIFLSTSFFGSGTAGGGAPGAPATVGARIGAGIKVQRGSPSIAIREQASLAC